MSLSDHSPFARDIAAVTVWWSDVGVDASFADEPTVWLEEKSTPENAPKPAKAKTDPEPPQPEPVKLLGGGKEHWPKELPAFQDWFAGDLAKELSGRGGVKPSGAAGADLMVIVPDPESTDGEALMGGELGSYLREIFAASDASTYNVYWASALPASTPHPDWDDLNARGVGDLLRHHIALAAPKRIIALGSSILPLLGNNPAQGPAEIQQYGQDSQKTPLFAAWQINRLRQRAAARKRFWKLWLDWIASDV